MQPLNDYNTIIPSVFKHVYKTTKLIALHVIVMKSDYDE